MIKNYFRILKKPHAYLQTILKTPVKFQKDRSETVGGVKGTKYLLKTRNHAPRTTPHGKPKTVSLHFSSKRRGTIKLLSSGKAPGSDAIPAEIYKAGGPPVAEKLTELFHIMWRKEAIPQEFKDATIIHLFKRKGNPQVCDNHRVISLLSIAGKILARVLLNRLNEHLERSGLLPESQCGFRKNRETIDIIFTARQLQEKCQEENVDLYMTFVDLTKALF